MAWWRPRASSSKLLWYWCVCMGVYVAVGVVVGGREGAVWAGVGAGLFQ